MRDPEAGERNRILVVSLGTLRAPLISLTISSLRSSFSILGVHGEFGMFPEIPNGCAKLCQARVRFVRVSRVLSEMPG